MYCLSILEINEFLLRELEKDDQYDSQKTESSFEFQLAVLNLLFEYCQKNQSKVLYFLVTNTFNINTFNNNLSNVLG